MNREGEELSASIAAGLRTLECVAGHLDQYREYGDELALAEADVCLRRVNRLAASLGLHDVGRLLHEVEHALALLRTAPRSMPLPDIDGMTATVAQASTRLAEMARPSSRARPKAACRPMAHPGRVLAHH